MKKINEREFVEKRERWTNLVRGKTSREREKEDKNGEMEGGGERDREGREGETEGRKMKS